jgi:transcriptional regulator with XRE-family HTH domain
MSEIFGKNITYLRKRKKLKQSEMLDFTGISAGTWSNYEVNKTEPDFDGLIKISKFFGVAIDVLLSEDVAVLEALGKLDVNLNEKEGGAENRQNVNLKVNPLVNLKGQNEGVYGSEMTVHRGNKLQQPTPNVTPATVPKVITIDSSGNENVLYVPVKARAGYLTGLADPQFISNLPAYRLPGYNNATYRIFETQGVSMFPTLQDKDRCVTRWSQVSEIRDDRVYVLITRNDGVLIKRCINRSNEGVIICKSDHNLSGEYPPIVLDLSEIMEVWYVVERWTRQLPGPGEIYKRIVNLEAAVTMLTHRLDGK